VTAGVREPHVSKKNNSETLQPKALIPNAIQPTQKVEEEIDQQLQN